MRTAIRKQARLYSLKVLVKYFTAVILLTSNLYAGGWLKQATATTIRVGPFVKIADGSLESSATVTSILVKLIAHSDTVATATITSFNPTVSGGGTHDASFLASAMYDLELTATDTATAGRFDVVATYTGCYPAFDSYMIVAPDAWDRDIGGDVATIEDVRNEMDANSTKLARVDVNVSTRLAPDTATTEPVVPLGSGATVNDILAWLKVIGYNKLTVTNTTKTYHNDADVAIGSQTLSDNGTTAAATKVAP